MGPVGVESAGLGDVVGEAVVVGEVEGGEV